jgi:hypothetical protein
MNFKHLLAIAVLLPSAAFGATITGKLVSGGGVDDMSITVQGKDGKKVQAYCDQKCGDWFMTGADTIETLRKEFRNRMVVLEYKAEKNNDRVAGWGEDAPPTFVKKITFLK